MDAAVGRRVLGEVEEGGLDEILRQVRRIVKDNSGQKGTRYKLTHILRLDEIQARHLSSTKSPTLTLSGRHLPLIYHLTSLLLSPPHNYTILLIDIDNRFDPTRLTCPPNATKHLYIQRPSRSSAEQNVEHVQNLVRDGETFMIYGEGSRQSEGREWWGTMVVGGGGGAVGDLKTGWKGWLRVDREAVSGGFMGMSAEEAWSVRERRQSVVDGLGWSVDTPWGGFTFHEGHDEGMT